MTAARRGTGGREVGAGPVLLVHGQPGRGADWEPVATRLSGRYEVLAPDRPGYDGTPATGMRANAAVLAGLLRDRGAGPAVVVGHSYGGGIALLLAEDHPELVAGLVLVASIGGEGSVAAVDRLLAAPVVGPAASAMALLASAWIGPRLRRRLVGLGLGPAQVLGRYLPDDRLAAVVGDSRARHSFTVEQRALVAELPAVVAATAAVSCPCVVLVGTRDLIVPPRAGARLAAAIGGAELWVRAEAGHFLPEDAPGAVARAVDRVAGRRPGA